MRQFLQTSLIATTLAAPLFKYPPYAAAVFTLVIIWNHLFPSEQPTPEVLLLPTKIPYLAALKPLDDPTPHIGEHCPTCWEELSKDNKPTKLVCGHVYCNSCLLEWIDSGKNTCPICKKVLFQQPLFTGKDLMALRIHKLRIAMSATTILTTLFRQILAFIARHPRGVPLSWNLLNPIYYLTGYGSWTKTLGAAATAISELAQVVTAKWLFDTHGVEWFRGFGNGHWMIWLPALWFGAYHLQQEVDSVADFAWVCLRMGVWNRGGKLGGRFLMSGLERSGALGRVAEAVDDLVVVVTAGWDAEGNKII